MALDNGGLKAFIRLSGRGTSCLAHAKPEIFVLGMVPEKNFPVYSTKFIFLIIRFVPGNVVMVAIVMCAKSPITGKWIYGITWKHVLHFIYFFYLFICLFNSILIIFYISISAMFVLANNRIFILKLFLFLSLLF